MLTHRMCLPGATPDEDKADADELTRPPPYIGEEEETFILEEDDQSYDDYLPNDNEEDVRLVWNQLPQPSSFMRTSFLTDVIILVAIVAIVYGLVVTTGSLFSTTPYASLTIDTSLNVLPWYAAQSLTRMLTAYAISLAFSLTYAYTAYRVEFAAKILILAIDVLQSIPLLSFLPGVVLGLIAIFPGARIGVELASVLLLVTSMAWNMLLGFYQSLRCLPHDLVDVAKTFKLSAWKRFWTVELPAGAITLVWNSIVSVAGGWFFLMSIESFELGKRDFKLPGLGSYLAMAAEHADYAAILAGLATVVSIIVLIDFMVWRPLIAWSAKFTMGDHAPGDDMRSKSAVLNMLQRSALVRSFHASVVVPAWDDFVNLNYRNPWTGAMLFRPDDLAPRTKLDTAMVAPARGATSATDDAARGRQWASVLGLVGYWIMVGAMGVVGAYCSWQAVGVMRGITGATWVNIASAAAATFARVTVALVLSLLWTVPAGVAIGRNAKLAARTQPLVQILASVPATALFPFLLLFLSRLGGGLEIGSVALMMLGTMWYTLFNVIAGAQALPHELFEVDAVYNRGGGAVVARWRQLILPGIFPYLLTGIVTAVGGAWNASIVSEFVVFQGGVLQCHGLGAVISQAAGSGQYDVLLVATVVMSLLVLVTNRVVWSPLYRLAESKYRM